MLGTFDVEEESGGLFLLFSLHRLLPPFSAQIPTRMRLKPAITFLLISNFRVRETHQIAEAQQEKNAKLREAFGISEYFVEGSSFDPDRKAKEDLAKSTALQQELQAQRDAEKEKTKRYALVRTPSKEKDTDGGAGAEDEITQKSDGKSKKKKKKRDE